MADDHGKKKDEKPKDEEKKSRGIHFPKPEGLSAWQAILWDLVIAHGLPYVWRLGQAILTHKVRKEVAKPEHLISFGEAMTALKAQDENAYDKINDFMRVRLTETKDREDFQIRSARMGGSNVQVTVDFLKLVAALPDHDARYEFLEMYGYVGERAADMTERMLGWGGQVVNFIAQAFEGSDELKVAIDTDTARLEDELERRRKRLLNNRTTRAGCGEFWRSIQRWWGARRERRQQLWRQRWERFRTWRQERREYKLRRLQEKEATRRVKLAQPKRRRFFTLFNYRSR
ncbi:MAG TPA: hypothetical protein VF974_01910 [Patescibacteria group bacterium]